MEPAPGTILAHAVVSVGQRGAGGASRRRRRGLSEAPQRLVPTHSHTGHQGAVRPLETQLLVPPLEPHEGSVFLFLNGEWVVVVVVGCNLSGEEAGLW